VSEQVIASEQPAGWRLQVGIGILALSVAAPVVGIPVVAALGLSAAMTASLSGALLASGEVFGVLAVAIMGKPGFVYVKKLVFGFFRQHAPPKEVSRRRYTIGLVMFCVPILFGWLSLYGTDMIPGFTDDPLPYAIGGDLLLLASLFVLGGNFWDKIRSLFVHASEARFSQG
jgi:hypothetical protein